MHHRTSDCFATSNHFATSNRFANSNCDRLYTVTYEDRTRNNHCKHCTRGRHRKHCTRDNHRKIRTGNSYRNHACSFVLTVSSRPIRSAFVPNMFGKTYPGVDEYK